MEIDLMDLESMLRGRINKKSVEDKTLSIPNSIMRRAIDHIKQQQELRKYQQRIALRKLKEYIKSRPKKIRTLSEVLGDRY